MKRPLIASLMMLMTLPVYAQQPVADSSMASETALLKKWHESLPAECIIQGKPKPYIFLGGEKNGTYSKIASDILAINEIDDQANPGQTKAGPGTYICVLDTQGGYNNALHIAENDADIGMVQVDNLDRVGRSDTHVANLRAIASLFPSAMHIVSLRDGYTTPKVGGTMGMGGSGGTQIVLSTEADLRGLPVAVWSSAVVSAYNMNEVSNLNMNLITVTTVPEGMKMLTDGKVAAFIGMGGTPTGWVSSLDRKTYRLLPISGSDINAMIDKFPHSGYTKQSLNYDNLGQVGVATIASQVEIVVQNMKGRRGTDLISFRDALVEGIDDIRERRGAHEAWKAVGDHPEVTLWMTYEGPKKVTIAVPSPTTSVKK